MGDAPLLLFFVIGAVLAATCSADRSACDWTENGGEEPAGCDITALLQKEVILGSIETILGTHLQALGAQHNGLKSRRTSFAHDFRGNTIYNVVFVTLVLVVAPLLIVRLLFLWLSEVLFNSIANMVVQDEMSKALGCRVTLGGHEVHLLKGIVEIKALKVENPSYLDFESPYLLYVGRCRIQISLWDFFTSHFLDITILSLILSDAHIVVEFKHGHSNVWTVLSHVRQKDSKAPSRLSGCLQLPCASSCSLPCVPCKPSPAAGRTSCEAPCWPQPTAAESSVAAVTPPSPAPAKKPQRHVVLRHVLIEGVGLKLAFNHLAPHYEVGKLEFQDFSHERGVVVAAELAEDLFRTVISHCHGHMSHESWTQHVDQHAPKSTELPAQQVVAERSTSRCRQQ